MRKPDHPRRPLSEAAASDQVGPTGSTLSRERGSAPRRPRRSPARPTAIQATRGLGEALPSPSAGSIAAFSAAVAQGASDHAGEVLRQFRVIFRSVKKHFQVVERKCGIGGSQLWALVTIAGTPGIRVSDLARTLSVHQSTASNLVEQMVRLGLIVRERDEDDHRVVRLNATPRGASLIARAPQPLVGLLPDALAQLTAHEVETLHSALARLLSVMQLRDESAVHTPLADL